MIGVYICNIDFCEKKSIGIKNKIIDQIISFNKSNKVDLIYLKEKKIILYDYETKAEIQIGEVKNKFEKMFLFYKKIEKKLINYNFIYLRFVFANRNLIHFFERYNNKSKIYMEIPTYPYKMERKNINIKNQIMNICDFLYKNRLKKYIDKIVTYSDDSTIYGIPCINISNGINLDKYKLINKNINKKQIIFTSVSNCSFWHGIDRFLYSLIEYGKTEQKIEILFNIVGEGKESEKLKKIVLKNEYLKKVVKFLGFQEKENLDNIYNNTDICIGCLGNHRKGIYTIQALKNKEYMAKGIPMVFSEDDPGMRGKKFIYKAKHDESLLNIKEIIEWYKKLEMTPEEIRMGAKEFSWDNQIKKILKQ